MKYFKGKEVKYHQQIREWEESKEIVEMSFM